MSSTQNSPTDRSLWEALEAENPLQVVGVINAYGALLAERVGFKAIYLSGAGVANASHGLPDLGLTHLNDVLEDVRRVTSATKLPLLVDADTGWGEALGIARTTREMIRAGAAGMHLEDQVATKRCGHRPGTKLVSVNEMVDRIKAAVDARGDADFVVMARTDSLASEGLNAALDRATRYVGAGADMIFAEGVAELEQYHAFTKSLEVPILANLTEFGRTRLFTLDQLREVGIRLALYPLSAFRAMSAAALRVYETIRKRGTQEDVVPIMQSREQLYEVLEYDVYEKRIDQLLRNNHEH